MTQLSTVALTAIGSGLSSATQTTGLAISSPTSATKRDTVVVVATAVTTGATLQIELKAAGSGNWVPTIRFAIAANGSYSFPLRVRDNPVVDGASQVRVNCTGYTDGTYTCKLSTVTLP